MKPGMQDDPFGAEEDRGVDIGGEVLLDRIADIRRVFGDIDRRGGVQPEMDAVALAARAQGSGRSGESKSSNQNSEQTAKSDGRGGCSDRPPTSFV